MKNITLGIFTSFSGYENNYIKACEDLSIEYQVIDLLSENWINNVRNSKCDGYLCSSTCDFQERKSILDERYFFISEEMKKNIYPSFKELFIHENKRNMANWLQLHGFPHVTTKIFTSKKEATDYLETCKYPIVSKASLGAGASKIDIINNKLQASLLLRMIFPNTRLSFLKLGKIYFNKIKHIPVPDLSNLQKHYLIIQEYKEILHEWRIIKIGNSYQGHQKLLKGKFASGSGKVGWVEPPEQLLNLVRNICEKGSFNCMAVDIFETKDHEYFVNELQSIFGSYLISQMFINGNPGRFIYKDGNYMFEEGNFNEYASCKLKVQDFVQILMNK